MPKGWGFSLLSTNLINPINSIQDTNAALVWDDWYKTYIANTSSANKNSAMSEWRDEIAPCPCEQKSWLDPQVLPKSKSVDTHQPLRSLGWPRKYKTRLPFLTKHRQNRVAIASSIVAALVPDMHARFNDITLYRTHYPISWFPNFYQSKIQWLRHRMQR